MSLRRAGWYTTTEIAELFGVACSIVYRANQLAGLDALRGAARA